MIECNLYDKQTIHLGLSIIEFFAEIFYANKKTVSFAKKGMMAEAISEYEKVIALDPNNAHAHHNLAVQYSKKGDQIGAFSGSCKLHKESLSPELYEELSRNGVAVLPLDSEQRIKTNDQELDRVLGGGMVSAGFWDNYFFQE